MKQVWILKFHKVGRLYLHWIKYCINCKSLTRHSCRIWLFLTTNMHNRVLSVARN